MHSTCTLKHSVTYNICYMGTYTTLVIVRHVLPSPQCINRSPPNIANTIISYTSQWTLRRPQVNSEKTQTMYAHISRSEGLAKTILQGIIKGRRSRSIQKMVFCKIHTSSLSAICLSHSWAYRRFPVLVLCSVVTICIFISLFSTTSISNIAHKTLNRMH